MKIVNCHENIVDIQFNLRRSRVQANLQQINLISTSLQDIWIILSTEAF